MKFYICSLVNCCVSKNRVQAVLCLREILDFSCHVLMVKALFGCIGFVILPLFYLCNLPILLVKLLLDPTHGRKPMAETRKSLCSLCDCLFYFSIFLFLFCINPLSFGYIQQISTNASVFDDSFLIDKFIH